MPVLISISSGAVIFLTEMAFYYEKPTDENNCGENSLGVAFETGLRSVSSKKQFETTGDFIKSDWSTRAAMQILSFLV